MTAIQAPRAPTLDRPPFDELRGSLRGEVLLPTSAGYDRARRLWNGAVDRRPAVSYTHLTLPTTERV